MVARIQYAFRAEREMTIRFRFDAAKAVEVVLYIALRSPNVYNALKVLYFADRQHLANHGRLICGDSYVAMSHGPVPSGTYDIIKHIRGDGFCWWADRPVEKAFDVQGNHIIPLREAKLEFLSESDIECLDAAIKEYGGLSFGDLKKLSHDSAFLSADQNDMISVEAIARSLPEAHLLFEYLLDA